MKTALPVILVLFCSTGALGQKATTNDGSGAGQPNLHDTISFMDKSVRPEESYIASESNPCDIELVRNQHRDFLLPSKTYVKSTDALGVKHHGFKYTELREMPPSQYALIPLSTIDPDSVNSSPAFSLDYITREHPDENPDALKLTKADLTVVLFRVRNDENTIKTGSTLSEAGVIIFDEKGTQPPV